MKRKFKIEDVDEYQTKSSLGQLYKTDLIQICQVLKIDTINTKETKSYIIDQILYHYNNNNNNNNQIDSDSDDKEQQQQQDNKRIYTEEELLSRSKQRVVGICKDLKIEYRESDTKKTLIQYIMVYQKTEVTPSSLSGGYSLPWSIISRILTQAWNDAKYCTCIYPQEFLDLQKDLNCKLFSSNETYSFKFLGIQFNSKIGQFTDQVKSNNQHCPQHAMYYRDDSLNHPWPHFNLDHEQLDPIQIQWKQSMLTISKKIFHHLSTTVSRTFSIPSNHKKMPRAAFEKSVWNHINNQYNGIKVANRIYIPPSNQVYLDAPPWFTKSIEHVTIDELHKTSINLIKLSKLVNLRSLVFMAAQNPEFDTLKNLTSITIDTHFHTKAVDVLIQSLDRPMTKLLFSHPSVILKAKDIVLESLQVIRLDTKTYIELFQNNNTCQDQKSPSSKLPNLRHVHVRLDISNIEIVDFILPDRVTTVTATTTYSNCNEEICRRFLENNPHITNLRLTYNQANFTTLGTISTQLKQSKLSRIMVYSKRSLTNIQHQQLIQSNVYFNSSKDMSIGQEFKKYIFYRNDQHNNQIINNNINRNIDNNNDKNNNILPTLPNIIIYKIIKLLWNSMNICNCDISIMSWYSNQTVSNRDILLLKSNQDFETIQSNCPYHCWVNRSSIYLSLSLVRHHQKSIYRVRLSALSTISKSTRSFVFKRLFTKFGPIQSHHQLFYSKNEQLFKTTKRISCTERTPLHLERLQQAKSIQLAVIPTINNQFPYNNLRKLNLADLLYRDINNQLSQFISKLELPLVKLILPLDVNPMLSFLAKHATETLKKSLENIQVGEGSDSSLLQQFPNIKHIIIENVDHDKPSFYTTLLVSHHRFTKLSIRTYSSNIDKSIEFLKSNPSIHTFVVHSQIGSKYLLKSAVIELDHIKNIYYLVDPNLIDYDRYSLFDTKYPFTHQSIITKKDSIFVHYKR
ncbi:hypothetical protein DFA_09162 [Cavenderia fasciculata]|uniref:Uncharacterized protein n=1 Tax=Cavenderia fasciculata TaxID=261658 RepID=F4Q6V5_CACFS|nr:uncharacterized protein DFA_09162 [Cavenderia fasciculata]EGG16137.1 hypothetical protein DFA_09162 [Cavenderia fasciculata]|eukprot:XP_004352590.1 hypothetical protein DFA_09162 [Cavenderia fasciculata]